MMKTHSRKRIPTLAYLMVGLFFSALIVASNPWNSDLLYSEALYRTWILGEGPLNEFHFSSSTFLFPDFFVYASIRSVFQNLNWVLGLYLFASITFLKLILNAWFPKQEWLPLGFLCVLIGISNGAWYAFTYPVHHGAQWLVGLFCLTPFLTKSKSPSLLTAVVVGALVASDILFGVNGLLPFGIWIVIEFFRTRDSKIFWQTVRWLFLMTLSAVLIYFGFKQGTHAYFGWNKAYFDPQKAHAFFTEFTRIDLVNLAAAGALVLLLMNFLKDSIARYFVISIFVSALFIAFTGAWTDINNVRYFYPLLFGIGYAFVKFVPARFGKTFAAAVLCLVLYRAQVMTNAIQQNPIEAPYSPAVACLDSLAQKESLVDGVGGYWTAKYLTYLSKRNLHVLQVNQHLEPFFWINNHADFIHFHPRFAIVDSRFTLEQVPKLKVDCGDFSVWIYDQALM